MSDCYRKTKHINVIISKADCNLGLPFKQFFSIKAEKNNVIRKLKLLSRSKLTLMICAEEQITETCTFMV